MYLFREKGKEYSVEKLMANLETLIKSALVSKDVHIQNTQSMFIGQRIKQYFMENDIRTPYVGRVVSYVPGYPEWMNVVYDDDLNVMCINLLKNIRMEILKLYQR